MTAALAAARQGDRHSHAPKMDDHNGALLAVAAGALVAAAGQGGVTSAAVGAGVASSGGGGGVTLRDVVPHSVSGAVDQGSPRTMVGASSLPVALAGAEPIGCHPHGGGPIRMGSATVFADGFRLARAGDVMTCGATICDGDKTVLVGGAPADAAPPDPLAVVQHGAAVASAAVGAAIAAGTAAVETAARWGEALAQQAVGTIEKTASEVEATAGAIAAEAGVLLGQASDAVGAVMGLSLAGAR
jgi:uncharacterized Zn-binding protein involved in type VI secretion